MQPATTSFFEFEFATAGASTQTLAPKHVRFQLLLNMLIPRANYEF